MMMMMMLRVTTDDTMDVVSVLDILPESHTTLTVTVITGINHTRE